MATTQSQYEQYLAWKQAIDDAARSAEYTRNRPWDSGPGVVVADMFGNVNDNPDVRAARENEYDRNMAQARYDKLASNLRVDQERNAIIQRSGGTPFPITQTPESIQQDAFGGLQRPGSAGLRSGSANSGIIHAGTGSAILKTDPISGAVTELWKSPEKKPDLAALKLKDLQQQRIAMLRRSAPDTASGAALWQTAMQKLDDEITALEKEMAFQNSAPAPTPAPPQTMTPPGSGRNSFGYIAGPLGANLFNNDPFSRGVSKVIGASTEMPPPASGSGLKILGIRKR